jgi:hypothetical protein
MDPRASVTIDWLPDGRLLVTGKANESQMDDAADVVERKFGGFVTATLIAVLRVPPGPNLTCVSRVQKYGEGFSPRIKMEIRIRAPLGGYWPIGDF